MDARAARLRYWKLCGPIVGLVATSLGIWTAIRLLKTRGPAVAVLGAVETSTLVTTVALLLLATAFFIHSRLRRRGI